MVGNEWREEYRRGAVKPLNGLLKAESVLNYKILRGQDKANDKANEVLWAALRHLVAIDPDINKGTLADLLGIHTNSVASWVAAQDALVQRTVDAWREAYRRGEITPLNELLMPVLGYPDYWRHAQVEAVLRRQLELYVLGDPLVTNVRLAELLGLDDDTVGRWRPRRSTSGEGLSADDDSTC